MPKRILWYVCGLDGSDGHAVLASSILSATRKWARLAGVKTAEAKRARAKPWPLRYVARVAEKVPYRICLRNGRKCGVIEAYSPGDAKRRYFAKHNVPIEHLSHRLNTWDLLYQEPESV